MSKGIQACDVLKTTHFVSECVRKAPVRWLVWKLKRVSYELTCDYPRVPKNEVTKSDGCQQNMWPYSTGTILIKSSNESFKQPSHPLTITQTHLVITEPVPQFLMTDENVTLLYLTLSGENISAAQSSAHHHFGVVCSCDHLGTNTRNVTVFDRNCLHM